MTSLLTTPLAEWHAAHGGRMVDFAGWSMPVQYGSIVVEHEATRRAAGLFDVSHMGRLAVHGPAAPAWLESLLTRRVEDLAPGRVRYTLVTSDEGECGCSECGCVVLDDALVAREPDAADGTPRFSLVVNASNRRRVVEWLERHLPTAGVVLEDRTFGTAMLAVQGALAVDIVCGLCSPEDAARIRALGNYRATTATVCGHPAAVSRTGYTGEDGLELVVPATSAVAVWEAIHAAGKPRGLEACGLGARDTLRLEAGMPLYGHELTEATDPFAIGLGFAITLDRREGGSREFPGAAALRGMRDRLPHNVRVGLALDSKRAAREGSVVVRPGAAGPAVSSQPGAAVGIVTSGSFSPSLGHAVAMALVDRACAEPGMSLHVLLRGEPVAARVVPLPFVRREPPGS